MMRCANRKGKIYIFEVKIRCGKPKAIPETVGGLVGNGAGRGTTDTKTTVTNLFPCQK
jgi:hypothetical protein